MHDSTPRPFTFAIKRYVENPVKGSSKYEPEEIVDKTFDGFGLFWEADAVARCLKGMLLLSTAGPFADE